jgi:hypothetical protein
MKPDVLYHTASTIYRVAADNLTSNVIGSENSQPCKLFFTIVDIFLLLPFSTYIIRVDVTSSFETIKRKLFKPVLNKIVKMFVKMQTKIPMVS